MGTRTRWIPEFLAFRRTDESELLARREFEIGHALLVWRKLALDKPQNLLTFRRHFCEHMQSKLEVVDPVPQTR